MIPAYAWSDAALFFAQVTRSEFRAPRCDNSADCPWRHDLAPLFLDERQGEQALALFHNTVTETLP